MSSSRCANAVAMRVCQALGAAINKQDGDVEVRNLRPCTKVVE